MDRGVRQAAEDQEGTNLQNGPAGRHFPLLLRTPGFTAPRRTPLPGAQPPSLTAASGQSAVLSQTTPVAMMRRRHPRFLALLADETELGSSGTARMPIAVRRVGGTIMARSGKGGSTVLRAPLGPGNEG